MEKNKKEKLKKNKNIIMIGNSKLQKEEKFKTKKKIVINKNYIKRNDIPKKYLIPLIRLIFIVILFLYFIETEAKHILKIEVELKENDEIYAIYAIQNKLSNYLDERAICEMLIYKEGEYKLFSINDQLIDEKNKMILKWETPSIKTDVSYMFFNLSNILMINFTNLNNNDKISVENMYCMLYGCSSLLSIDLSNFDTTNVQNMNYMFYGCSSLSSINLSNFNTTNVKYMNHMFLISVDLSNFDTTDVENISYMFYGCTNLNSINLSKFNTSVVKYMNHMFYERTSLISVDLSNFDTTEDVLI